MVLCFGVNSVLIAVTVVFTYSSMFKKNKNKSTCIPQCHQLWFDLIVKMLKVFHENIQCYIIYIYISYQDVTYDLFFYLSDFDLFVKFKNK